MVVEEALASGDSRFVELIRACEDGKGLARIVERWKKDFRPWAREQIFAYLKEPMNRPNHHVVVKRLFKHAYVNGDDEVVGAFMVAFDRLVERRKVRRHRVISWRPYRSETDEALVAWADVIPPNRTSNDLRFIPISQFDLFSNRTRNYLRRRAWRYFRRLGHQKPERYVPALAGALARYREEALADGLKILNSWSLMHACFGESDAVKFTADHANLAREARLDQMVAPYFEELWAKADAAGPLVELVFKAEARLVRLWAVQLLRKHHRDHLNQLSFEVLLKLLDHTDPEVAQFGAQLLESTSGLEKLDLATWLKLLETTNLTALGLIAQAMRKHVVPGRLTLAQTVELACARPVPVARLGMEFLKQRNIATAADRAALARLAEAKCGAVGREAAGFALAIIGSAGLYGADNVSRFFDSLTASVRAGAWDWLTEKSPGWNDPALWSRLIETPYDDVRLKLITALEDRARMARFGERNLTSRTLPGLAGAALASIWCPVLLAIHRGGRVKLTALRQISLALRDQPEAAEQLAPVLAVALRSVRVPEARGALGAIVAAVEEHPEIEPVIRRFVPELQIEGVTP